MVGVLVRNSLKTAAGALEALPLVQGKPLKWYACGPTVYDSAHLGHARTYVCQDIIRRIITDVFGYQVFYVMGVTDVDDKIIKKAVLSKQDTSAVSRRYEMEFWQDMDALGVRRPSAVVRVTEHMDVIRSYISGIMEKGMAYQAKDGVYFDVARFTQRFRYGKLTAAPGVQGAAQVVGDEDGKKDARDFALWKLAKPSEPSWESPWGAGRPGWHIECSAMTHHVLGDRFDLHTGGVDLQFPHHCNEIAQCEAYLDREDDWVSTWLHTGHLYIKGLKMSKSLKNFITIRSLLLDHHPDDFRVFCLQHRYSANVDYSESQMAQARALRRQFLHFTALARPSAALGSSSSGGGGALASKRWGPAEFDLHERLLTHVQSVEEALRTDFDTPAVLRQLQSLMACAHHYEQERRHQKRGGGVEVEEAMAAVAAYVGRTLELLGVQSAGQSYAVDADDRKVASREELAEAFTDFRSQVRAVALADSGDLRGTILRLCDDFRDGTLMDLGLEVKDLQDAQRPRWTLGEKRRRAEKEEEEEQRQQDGSKQAATAWSGVDKAKLDAKELFMHGPYTGLFSRYDDDGVPTHLADGEELSKAKRAKLVRKWRKHQGQPVKGGNRRLEPQASGKQ